MAIGGDDAPAQHMRALAEIARRVDGDRTAVDLEAGQPFGRSVRPDQRQHKRRDGLVEGQREAGRRLRQHGAVAGVGGNQRGMGEGHSRQGQPEQEGDEKAAYRDGRAPLSPPHKGEGDADITVSLQIANVGGLWQRRKIPLPLEGRG